MDLLLDTLHDLTTVDNDLSLTTDRDKVAQELSIRLQFYLAEWFLDNTVGIPYLQVVFQKGVSLQTINSIFISEINRAEDVNELIEYSSEFDNDKRELTISFKVDTTFGILSNSETIRI